MIKTVLFDYGGTLDTAARHWSYVISDGYKHAGIDLTTENFRSAYVYAERVLAKFQYIKKNDDFLSLLRKKIAIEFEYLESHGILLMPDMTYRLSMIDKISLFCDDYAYRHVRSSAKILSSLSKKYRLVMVSNFYGNLPTVLRTYGVSRFFDSVIESAIVGVRKPDPEIYRLGVNAAKVKPVECVVIGDSFTKDIQPATLIGCKTIWFKGEEWEDKEYDESLPTYVVKSLDEILGIL